MSEFERLHPSLQYHVVNTLGWSTLRPTQLAAIAPIHAGSHCLLLAPTAGGKTEAAAIPILSRMLNETWTGTSVLYVCPIKALLNNLEPRLSHYAGLVGRRVEVWHGDVSQSRKQRAMRDPPDILLTTPESIEGMLISARVDRVSWFGNLRAVVVDELHAFANDDRGWHLRSILNRLDRYVGRPLQRIGLSATVSNPEELLAWFAPVGDRIVVGSASVSTDAEVTIDHVESLENAAIVISRINRGEKRLVFCDSRSNAEKLSSLLRGHDVRTFISHASLSAAERRQAEAAFSEEKDCVIVATSTLELGIDVGDLDRVIQIDSPSSVSSFLQRMGRTGRRSGIQRNCLFLTTNDNAFLLALGVTQRWSEAWVEAAVPPGEPWHIVAQQGLAMMLEYGQLPFRQFVELLSGSFPELDHADTALLVEHLIALRYLERSDDLVSIGQVTEEQFGRSHYRELLASFSGSQLLTGRYGSADIGYIDPTVVSSEGGARLILLAGRSWRVTQIEWSKRTVWLEPATEGGAARWIGGSRSLSSHICQGIRVVLAARRSAPVVNLSHRASAHLESMAEDLAISAGTHFMVDRADDGSARTWTFAGTRANRRLARELAKGGEKVRFDALTIGTAVTREAGVSKANREAPLALESDELKAFGKSIKFSECLPHQLLQRTIACRYFDTDSYK